MGERTSDTTRSGPERSRWRAPVDVPGARMEGLREALARLEAHGYDTPLQAVEGGLRDPRPEARGRVIAPEDLVIDEVVRFEGASDPEEQAALFALSERGGSLRGTFVATYGANTSPEVAAAVQGLVARHRR